MSLREFMKVILLASFIIDFFIEQTFVNSITSANNLLPLQLRRKKTNQSPNYGYEPYWQDNEWVFSRHVTTVREHTVTCTPMVCAKLYKEFGEVCGRDANNVHKTFRNYCEMQNVDCSDEKIQKWIIAYGGKCVEDLKTFPTIQSELVSRAEEYVRNVSRRMTTKRTHAITYLSKVTKTTRQSKRK